MAEYKILLTKKAVKQLDKLPDNVANPIIVSIEKLASDPRPNNCKKIEREKYRSESGKEITG